jgi:serine/threonine protein kinase/predicted ATPase
MIGIKLGPYEILEEVGKGGMATVYRAYQPAMERQVAIKVIHKAIANDALSLERFRREARLIARLEHAHILPVYDFDGSHDPPYIVMRYLESGTLKEVLNHGQLSLTEVGYILNQIAGALDYAHRQGIIHRDVKPSNIMLDREANVFVTDFGLARIISGDWDHQATGITQVGTVMGSLDYMAPEQATGEHELGPAVDIYALGVMLFQLLTKQLPYTAENPLFLMYKHANDPIPSAVALNPDLPPALDGVLARAMAKKPGGRYPSALALANAVTEILGETASPTPAHLRATAVEMAHLSPNGEPFKDSSETPTTPTEQNKVVTALYLDGAEYAALVEEKEDTEAARQAIHSLWVAVSRIVEDYNGQVVTQTEEGLLALWGVELTHEDDPEQAIRAALAILDFGFQLLDGATQAEIKNQKGTIPLRLGVNTGPVLLTITSRPLSPSTGGRRGKVTASGASISLASRLAQYADGAVLISHNTFRHVLGIFDMEPEEPIQLRKNEIAVYRIMGAKSRAFRRRIRGVEGVETKLIGREVELKRLQDAFFAAVEDGEVQVVTLLSEAGLGKSRLLAEFRTWAELRPESFWLFQGRATPEMTNRPYALLRDILSFRFEIYDNDRPAIVGRKLEQGVAHLLSIENPEMAHLIGYLVGFDLADSLYLKELRSESQHLNRLARQAFIHFFAGLTEQSPAVIYLEDLHWADEASLDLLADVANTQPDRPLLILGVARPLLIDRRKGWGRGQGVHIRLELAPLSKRESRTLVREILQKVADLPRELIELIGEQAEGNPYYIEELIKMLIEERIIQKGPAVWTVEMGRLANLSVPPALRGLLQARLDGLLYPERITLQRAAVIGRLFWDSAINALEKADGVKVGEIETILSILRDRDLIYRREMTTFAGCQEYVFSQNMLREVVYDNMVKRQQQAYHVAVAEWLLQVSQERSQEHTALIAEHYEQAGEEAKAIQFLTQAGEQALKVGALKEAGAFYQRALVLLNFPFAEAPLTDLEKKQISLLLQLGEVYWLLAAYGVAQRHLNEALALARKIDDPQGTANALYQLSQVAISQGQFTTGQILLAESLALARQLDDSTILARLLYGLGDLAWRLGQFEEANQYLEESVSLARAEGDLLQTVLVLNRLGTVSDSLHRYPEARQRYEEGLALAAQLGARKRLANLLNNLGIVDFYEEKYDEARQRFQEALVIHQETGERYLESLALINLGLVALKQGNIAEANYYAQAALQVTQNIGALPGVLTVLTLFAELRVQAGEINSALELLGLAFHHPAIDTNTQEGINRILRQLNLDPQVVEAGLAVGQALDFEATVAELLAKTPAPKFQNPS